ncbi:Vms1/Ankzf1 family peptidyl-tRNA hydrolase [Nocardioides sp. DS6]|uniref:Vms1/Ankzf1 family peptidyl-tRNA hydrolase n=1 Tax=Nocardioides eburneus TaxID=3231482 RepID=A0ABV3SVD0_9ACTN
MDTTTLTSALQGAGPFATVLADVSQDTENGRHEHDLRVRAACEQLSEQGAPREVVDLVAERLGEIVRQPSPTGRIVVATPEGIAYDEVALTRVDQPVATWDALPDLMAWVAHRDATLPFVLALVDHEGGDISLWDSDLPEPEVTTSAGGEDLEFVHQMPVGGWGSLEVQRTTENTWKENAEDVAAEVERLVRAHGHPTVLLGGDPTSVGLVRKALADLPATVVELTSGQRTEDGGDEALHQAIREALLGEVVRRRSELAHRLREALGRGDTGAAGVGPVADALVRGQVETLVVDPAALSEVTLNPADHPGLAFGGPEPLRPVRADEALIAAAIATDADVTTLPGNVLGGQPVAAILRWTDDR